MHRPAGDKKAVGARKKQNKSGAWQTCLPGSALLGICCEKVNGCNAGKYRHEKTCGRTMAHRRYGAGYGSRTRLFGLGSRRTTDVLTQQTSVPNHSTVPGKNQGEFPAFFGFFPWISDRKTGSRLGKKRDPAAKFCYRALSLISFWMVSTNSDRRHAPASPSRRERTEMVPLSASFSPTMSIYGIFCSWASRIL